MKGKSGEGIAIHLVYRSPNSTKENDGKLCEWMRMLKGQYLVIGDFNFPGVVWGEGKCDTKSREFLNVVESKFLTQHVTEPTHISGNVLDLILSLAENLVKEVQMEGRLGGSDHEILVCSVGMPMERKKEKIMIRDFGKADFIEMRR